MKLHGWFEQEHLRGTWFEPRLGSAAAREPTPLPGYTPKDWLPSNRTSSSPPRGSSWCHQNGVDSPQPCRFPQKFRCSVSGLGQLSPILTKIRWCSDTKCWKSKAKSTCNSEIFVRKLKEENGEKKRAQKKTEEWLSGWTIFQPPFHWFFYKITKPMHLIIDRKNGNKIIKPNSIAPKFGRQKLAGRRFRQKKLRFSGLRRKRLWMLFRTKTWRQNKNSTLGEVSCNWPNF